MLIFRSLIFAFRQLQIESNTPVIIHASLSSFGQVQGGADTVVGALLATFECIVAPAFTYKTMLTPENGPVGNGIIYGSGKDTNRMAEFYRSEMPVDRLIGAIPETLRRHPKSRRSIHPILSFTGIHAETILQAQTLQDPLVPIKILAEQGGWVALLGVDHTVNTSIHYGEQVAGRKQFTRWALTPQGVVECPRFPTCSLGFSAIEPRLKKITRQVKAGAALIQAIPLPDLIDVVRSAIAADPLALLCEQSDCERCAAVRADLQK